MGIRRPAAPDLDDYLDEDEEIPTVVSKARDEDEDDDRPARSQARRIPAPREADEDDRPARKSRLAREVLEDEDEDVQVKSSSRVAAGWGAARSLQSEGGDYTSEFRLTEDPKLIKFVGDEPFAVYRQHFLREKEGKKSYICLGRGCPLCEDLGHSPDKKFAFTVVDLTDETYGATILVSGPRLLGVLEKANSGKYGPLSTHYWEIARVGTGQKTSYTLNVVKDRYLKDDYDIDPVAVETAVAKIKPFDTSAIKETSKAELREIVADLDS